MSGPEHLPPDDRELEEFLAGQGPQLARYRAASREQPPPALDAQVLAQARAALPARRGVLQGWRLPLSLAATLVLGFGLLSRVQREPLPPAVSPAQQADGADGAEAAMLASGSAAAPLAEQQAAATARPAEAARGLAEAARRDQDTARARAAWSTNQAAMASAHQRETEASAKQAAAVAAVPPPVVAQAEPSPPPALMLMAPATAPAGPGPAASLTDADAVVAAAPAAAWQARGPVAAKTAPRPPAQAAVAPGAEAAWRYRNDQGWGLELPPGHYRLRAAGGELLASGERRLIEEGREQLLGLGGGGDCRLWLEPPTEGGLRRLAGDCESDFAGEYRRADPAR